MPARRQFLYIFLLSLYNETHFFEQKYSAECSQLKKKQHKRAQKHIFECPKSTHRHTGIKIAEKNETESAASASLYLCHFYLKTVFFVNNIQKQK